jgi:UDP-3-O-[3-hydroxymyristoyl] glucosamine N-acyltransferase
LTCRLEGDGDVEIVRVAGIQQAQPGDLTFVANSRYLAQLATPQASAVILGRTNPADLPPPAQYCGPTIRIPRLPALSRCSPTRR